VVLMPSSLRAGLRNGAVTPLYFAGQSSQAPAKTDSAKSHRMSAKALLNWRPAHNSNRTEHGQSVATADTKAAGSGENTSMPPVGAPFGLRSNGSSDGPDIQPALPVVAPDPHVDAAEIQDGPEGDVIVEVTIDERGNIVEKKVLRSLTPAVDLKVLAALEAWHFQPATRNGVAISSKQDVSYHFRHTGS
jgi:protein TonB